MTKADLGKIVDLMLTDVNATLAKKGLTLTVTPEAKQWLITQGFDEAMGARPLRRVIETNIRDEVTDYYLEHLDAKHLQATVEDGQIKISAAPVVVGAAD